MNSPLSIVALLSFVSLFVASESKTPFPGCKGEATYKVTFFNLLKPQLFGSLIPQDGLVYSPLAGVSHSNRLSFFTIRGYASKAVEQIAETGVNDRFIRRAKRLRRNTGKVTSVVDAGAPTMPGKSTTVELSVTCQNPFLTVIGMIAPSPDWIVQINNFNTVHSDSGAFIRYDSGTLIAYDTGVDDGREFTPPLDLTLDLPTEPRQNIAPLVEDETDRFEGRVVGKYFVKRIK